MRSTFIRAFAGVSLALTSFILLIATAMLLIAFSIPTAELTSGNTSFGPLSTFILNHFRLVGLAWWLYFFLGVIASVGLLRHKQWASSVWVGLLAVALLWLIVALASEVLYLVSGGPAPEEQWGLLHRTVFPALVTIFPGLVMIALVTFLLRKLIAYRRDLKFGQ